MGEQVEAQDQPAMPDPLAMSSAVEILVGATRTDPEAPSLADLAERVFREPLAELGYRPREGQIRMARAVAEAIRKGPGSRLAIEAPTGLGKSLGHLVPGLLAVLRAEASGIEGAKMIVSTAGIPLQRQLVQKDIPMLAKALGIEVRASVLKGLANYACRERLDDLELTHGPEGEEARRVLAWLNAGGSGDREDLPWPLRRWSALAVAGDECLGRGCPKADACIGNAARKRSLSARIVVMNHAYLALAGGKWLTDKTVALVADEAHDLEDSIRRAASLEVTIGSARHWRREVYSFTDDGALATEVEQVVTDVVLAAAARTKEGRERLFAGWWDRPEPQPAEPIERAAKAIEAIETEDDHYKAKLNRAIKGLNKLATRVRYAVDVPDRIAVWMEQRGDRRREAISIAPVDARLPDRSVPTILCSATLGAGHPAEAAKALGIAAEGLVLPSPWPLERMAVCVVPKGPDPKDSLWKPWAEEQVVEFVERCGGGVLVLASSWVRAEAYAIALRRRVSWPVLFQGEAGRAELVEKFRSIEDSILVGTASFRQGIDVQGRACRGVVIDRLPFPQANDPLEQAIGETLKDPFRERSVPIAAQALRQAVGRLLRSESDRGAVAILDSRLMEAPWARRLRDAVAPIPLSASMEDVSRLLRGEEPLAVRPRAAASAVSARSARSARKPAAC
jgi:ATP-dependent DNA helicase DinG